MGRFSIRQVSGSEDDQGFLGEMLYEAASWRATAPRPLREDVLQRPGVALYVEGWGRSGDVGFVAEGDGQPVGAAWYRLFTQEEHGYGFLSADVPELTIAVRREARGHGVGTALLETILRHAQSEEFSAVSLRVECGNPAVRLYERFGFTRVVQVGNAWTMRLEFPGALE